MLGKLASLNSEIGRRIIQWFDEDLEFYAMHRNPFVEDAVLSDTARHLRDDPPFAAIVERFMRDADIGIRDLRIVDEKVVGPVLSGPGQKAGIEGKQPTRSFIPSRHEGWADILLPQAARIIWHTQVCGFDRGNPTTQPAKTSRLR